MFRKLLLVTARLPAVRDRPGAAPARDKPVVTRSSARTRNGCLEIRNSGREDIQVTVYTAGSGAITVRIMSGHTEKVYKTSRTCVPAVDYVRADAEFEGGIFAPPTH